MLAVENQLHSKWSQPLLPIIGSIFQRGQTSRYTTILSDEYKSRGEALCFPPSVKTFRWEERERKGLEPKSHHTTLVP